MYVTFEEMKPRRDASPAANRVDFIGDESNFCVAFTNLPVLANSLKFVSHMRLSECWCRVCVFESTGGPINKVQ